MTRMLLASLMTLLLTQMVSATDNCITPYGKRPFSAPKAPCPNGVLASGVCFGYHATRWTPWLLACQDCGATVAQVAQGTQASTKGIILFEQPARTAPASQLVPSPEQVKPMPPVRP